MKITIDKYKKITRHGLAIAALPLAMNVSALSVGDYLSLLSGIEESGSVGTGGKNFDDITPLGTTTSSGEFSVLSWNVTGKPSSLNGLDSGEAKEVSTRIQDYSYDIVGVQEIWIDNKLDQFSHNITDARYKGRSKMWRGGDNEWGNGLWTIAKYPLNKDKSRRAQFSKCAGGPNTVNSLLDIESLVDLATLEGESPDCLAEKGFMMSPITLHDNLVVHVYNTHLNTNSKHNEDTIQGKKESQLKELANAINEWSGDYPVVVVGDFNMKVDDTDIEDQWEVDLMAAFAADAGLTYACKELETQAEAAGTATELPCTTSVDHLAYRGNHEFSLKATSWLRPEGGKVGKTHNAVASTLEYTKLELDLSIPGAFSFQAGGFRLNAGESIQTQTRKLIMQTDGNLVLYNNFGSALWASGTSGSNFYVKFTSNGNFIVYNANGNDKWKSKTAGDGDTLNLQGDGNLVIRKGNGNSVWSSGTNQ